MADDGKKEVALFDPERLKKDLQARVRDQFLQVIPDEQWDAMIEGEIKGFFENERDLTIEEEEQEKTNQYGGGTGYKSTFDRLKVKGTPFRALVYGALTTGGDGAVTGANFTRLFEDTGRVSYIDPLQAVRWSLTFALGATLVAAVVGTGAATAIARTKGGLGPLVDGLLMLPLAVPAVVLGFGYLTTFNRGWYDLRGSPWLLLAAHSLIGYPFVLRAVLAVLQGIDPRLPEAARVLGASPWRVWRHIELPIATRALLAGSVFAFAISLGEFGATLLLRRREFATMPIAIFEALGRPGDDNLGRALAMATVLMVVTAVAFLLIDRVRYRDVGEF